MSINNPLSHVGATWCHLEPSYVPYSLNQLFGWDFFCFFLQQNRSSLLQASPRGWELPDSCSRKANAGSLICSMNQRLSYNLDISYYLSFNFIPSFFYMTFSIFFCQKCSFKVLKLFWNIKIWPEKWNIVTIYRLGSSCSGIHFDYDGSKLNLSHNSVEMNNFSGLTNLKFYNCVN